MGDEEPDAVDFCETPTSMQGLRSCLRCGLIKNFNQFYEHGCENCPFLELPERQDRVERCTTSDFEGMFSMMKPEDSWVARWEGLTSFYPGIYALRIFGVLPDEVDAMLQDLQLTARATKLPEDQGLEQQQQQQQQLLQEGGATDDEEEAPAAAAEEEEQQNE
ncbi:hypothetical protein CTAYLR_007414 [Chrysophaeum taylorii]|uniref:Spt4/RpoE2 zinc finger domain-containing protein n=1 Tax=Chrysophaeum taylorii TaxID=2483200 RepID=A0AAD7U4X3_9STRA|nr:hypothetical protein CTAYLR_007414 [Chrysophaeum taylorii]